MIRRKAIRREQTLQVSRPHFEGVCSFAIPLLRLRSANKLFPPFCGFKVHDEEIDRDDKLMSMTDDSEYVEENGLSQTVQEWERGAHIITCGDFLGFLNEISL